MDEKTNVGMNSNILDHKESIFSDEKILDNSTRNENGNIKEQKDKITFEDHQRSKNPELSPPINSTKLKNKIFIEIPQYSNSKDKMNNTPTFSSQIQINNVKSNSPSMNNEETYSDYFVDQTIDSQLLKETPDILLEEIEGEQLNGKKLIISAAGLQSSPRKSKDGFVFFGTSIEDVIYFI